MIAITGAAGAVGSALVRTLKADYHVISLDRAESSEADESIIVDLTRDDSVATALQAIGARHGAHLASVIHLAAYFDFTGEQHPLYRKLNVEGTARLLRALQAFEVEQFVFSSTMLVHAPTRPGEKIDESSPIGPRWVYPQSKVATEHAIRAERGAIPVVLLRLAGLYSERSVIPTLAHQISRIYERNPHSHFYPDGLEAGQSTLHEQDMVEAFRLTLERRGELPEVTEILIGEEEALSYGELQDRLGRLIHGDEEWSTLIVPTPLAKAGAWAEETLEPMLPEAITQGEKPFIRPFMVAMANDHYALDISRARRLLGWEPRHNLRDTLPAMIDVLKRDPPAWYRAHRITPPPWLQVASEVSDDPEEIRARYETQVRTQHADFLWAHFLNVAIGCWLLVASFVLGYHDSGLAWSDGITGVLIIALALLSLSWQLRPIRWLVALLGVWLLLAPLLFWAPTGAAYLNGMFCGALVAGLAAAARPAPGISPAAALTGPTIPPGWTASPSSWLQRLPIIALAFVGLFCSMYMTGFQLGYLEGIWDPFFNPGLHAETGTAQVITSDISAAFPVPDAGLGAVVYMLEIILGLIGSRQRWRTMPWVVAAFGFLIVPLGIVSITFIIIQPILIGTWCGLCLIAAAAMLLQIAYSVNELVATGGFLKRRMAAGQPLLRIFFTGDTDTGPTSIEQDDFERPPRAIAWEIISEGVSVPWNLALCVLVGVWLMFTRLTLGAEGAMANADHLIGSLIITCAVISWGEVARAVRYLNIPLGAALLVTPFLFTTDAAGTVASLVAGIVVMLASLRRGRIKGRYGDWQSCIV